MLGAWANSFRMGNEEAALIVFKDVCLEVSRKDVSSSNGHIIDETVGGELLDQGS